MDNLFLDDDSRAFVLLALLIVIRLVIQLYTPF